VSAVRVDAPPGPKYADLDRAAGRRIAAVDRRGKFLLLPLEAPGRSDSGIESGDCLVIHLGMSGVVRFDPPEKHLRVRMELDPGPRPVLYFEDPRRFGRFLVTQAGSWENLPALARMGPEPLTPAFTVEGFAAALKRSRTAVKTYLLSQKPVAGVGNIYADEALWRARVHPETPAARLSKVKIAALHEAIREVLAAAVAEQGTTWRDYRTVNGNVGNYVEQLDVYGRPEEPCPRCGTLLRKIMVAARGTHFCPTCQRRR
jgi:formamidopyrimidine-DNA glycosylase